MGYVGDNAQAQHKKVFLLLFVHKKKPSLPLAYLFRRSSPRILGEKRANL
jgi:hypothetical protein